MLKMGQVMKRFEREVGFKKPLDREWKLKELAIFTKGDLRKKYGGLIDSGTSLKGRFDMYLQIF